MQSCTTQMEIYNAGLRTTTNLRWRVGFLMNFASSSIWFIFFASKKCFHRIWKRHSKVHTLFDNAEVFARFSLKISSQQLKDLFFRMKIYFSAFLAILKRNMTLHLCWYNEASIFYVTLNLTKMMLMKGNKSHNFRRSFASFFAGFFFASPQQGEIKYYFPFVSGECSLFILRCMWRMHERFISVFFGTLCS